MKLTAMTYNIRSGRNLAGELNIGFAAEVINRIRPDFVTLNEVRRFTSDVGDMDEADALGRLTGYYPVFGKSIDVMGGEYGNALLTRLPMTESEVIHIPDPEKNGPGFWEHRTILRCVLLAENTPVTVLCTHFGLMPGEQRNAVDTAVTQLSKEQNPTFFMGDLNMEPDAEILKPLLYAMEDSAGYRNSPLTFPSDKPNIKIDYILHTPEIHTLSLRTEDTQNSDHRPLIAEVEL